MSLGEEESEQRRGFADSLRHADVSMEELWLRYFTLGGLAGQFEVEAYIYGAMALPALQRDVLAHALNERLDEMLSEATRAPYSPHPAVRADAEGGADDPPNDGPLNYLPNDDQSNDGTDPPGGGGSAGDGSAGDDGDGSAGDGAV